MKSIFSHLGNSHGTLRTISFCLLFLLTTGLVTMAVTTAMMPATAAAQDDDIFTEAPAEGAAEEAAPAAEEPAAAADAPAAAPAAETPESDTLLVWMAKSLGWFYSIAFLVLSITLVSFLVTNILGLRREAVLPNDLIVNFEAELKEKRYQEAYQLAKGDESFLGQVLSAGLSKLQFGYDQAVEAMQETSEDENMRLEHRLSYISLIGNISPMVGLMGTVQGMISAFQVIASSGATPDPGKLAAGISTALFTTLVGLMVAIPAIAAFSILRNRAARLVLEAGIASEDLMSRFQSSGKRKRPSGSASSGGTSAGTGE